MNLQKTKIALGGYQDIVRFAEREHKSFCEELQKLEAMVDTYVPEKINSDRQKLFSDFAAQMRKRERDLTEAAENIITVYEKDISPSENTCNAVSLVLQYVQTAGEDISEDQLKILLQPIYEANDIKMFNVLRDLINKKSPKIRLSQKLLELSEHSNIIQERFQTLLNATMNKNRLEVLASEESYSSSLDPARGLTKTAVGDTFSGLFRYAEETKTLLDEMVAISKDSKADDKITDVKFSFNFKHIGDR